MRNKFLTVLWFVAALASAQTGEAAIRQHIIDVARKYLGVPYVYGAMSPRAFDCSGFVGYVYREAAGLVVPRGSRDFMQAGRSVSLQAALPGDVMVFDTVGGRASHVAIYLGNNQFIHAASATNSSGVIISSMNERYYAPRLLSVRRFPLPPTPPGAGATAPPAGAASPGPAQAAAPALTPGGGSGSGLPLAAAAPVIPSASGGTSTGGAVADQAALAAAAALASTEVVIADIGFDIPATRTTYVDPIPTSVGTELAFTVRNTSGRSGRFVVVFYKMDPRRNIGVEIHRQLVTMDNNAYYSLPSYRFVETGRYRLIVKDNSNNQLMERIFTVQE